MQVEAMIDQNTLISQQLTLWDQTERVPHFVLDTGGGSEN